MLTAACGIEAHRKKNLTERLPPVSSPRTTPNALPPVVQDRAGCHSSDGRVARHVDLAGVEREGREHLGPIMAVVDVTQGVAHTNQLHVGIHHVSAVASRVLPLVQCAFCGGAPRRDVLAVGRDPLLTCSIPRALASVERGVAEVAPVGHVPGVQVRCLPQTAVQLQFLPRLIIGPVRAVEAVLPQLVEQQDVIPRLCRYLSLPNGGRRRWRFRWR